MSMPLDDNTRIIGTCSLCGGAVFVYTALAKVGPMPPPQCASCGARKRQPHGQVIPMEPSSLAEAASVLGRMGGRKGGDARARSLTPERRTEIAKFAADTRWGNNNTTTPDEAAFGDFNAPLKQDTPA